MAIAGTVAIVLPHAVAAAAEDCLTEPTGEKSDAQHWYYRFDRGTNRRCWYLKDANATSRDGISPVRPTQQPAAWDFAQPAPPKLTPRRGDGPVSRTSSDALAELPQPRVRTDIDVRGTPRPQNLAITPTTLTASDANLQRGLDASSPWPSAPPQQTEPATSDSSPAAMVDDGGAGPDANAAPAADGQPSGGAKSAKPEAPIHMLMLVVGGALAISGLLASALYRLSHMGRRRQRGESWQAAARVRRARMKPRVKAKATPSGQRNGRGNKPAESAGMRRPQSASALDLASTRLSAAMPDPMDERPFRAAPPAAHREHPRMAQQRRDAEEFAEMQRPQPTDAVWQAVDQLAELAPVRQPPPPAADAMPAAALAPSPQQMPYRQQPASPQMPPAPVAPAQIAAAQFAPAQIAAAQAAAQRLPISQGQSSYASANGPGELGWQVAEHAAPASAAPPAFPAARPPPPAAPSSQNAPAPVPAPVDVGEIVSALRRARPADGSSSAGGAAQTAAPLDAAKVIAALLVSRAAKRRAAQAAGNGEVPAAAAAPREISAPATEASAAQTMQAAQNLVDRLRGANTAAQAPIKSDQAAAASADPAAALIETLRAHAARQPAYQRQSETTAAEEPAMLQAAPEVAEGPDMDDPAAALINLLQSRFALPEDELESDAGHDAEEFAPEPPEENGELIQDDPAARLMRLLESRSSIPAAPVAEAPQPQRRLFVPPPFEDPAGPPLDFIPRPQALRPRARNIQQDESLDGIQDILARLGRRA